MLLFFEHKWDMFSECASKIFEDFKCNNNAGLSTYLSGISDFKEIVQATEIENLFLVSGGPVPPNPSEL